MPKTQQPSDLDRRMLGDKADAYAWTPKSDIMRSAAEAAGIPVIDIGPRRIPSNLRGTFPGEFSWTPNTRYRATGEKRAPRKGEYYLSGAVITAYQANTDKMTTEYWIAEPVQMIACPHCAGTPGKVPANV